MFQYNIDNESSDDLISKQEIIAHDYSSSEEENDQEESILPEDENLDFFLPDDNDIEDPDYVDESSSGRNKGGSKSKSSSNSNSSIYKDSYKKIRNDYFSNLQNDMRSAAGFKTGRKKKKKGGRIAPGDKEPSEEIKSLLGLANQAYASGNLDEAESVLCEIIRIDNQVYAAWKTLGEIHRQRGDIIKCLLSWISAGHLRLKDAELWAICGKLSMDIKQMKQALYCYNRAALANPQNPEYIFERALVYKEVGQFRKAIDSFKRLSVMLPDNPAVVRELARLYVSIGKHKMACKLYEDMLSETKLISAFDDNYSFNDDDEDNDENSQSSSSTRKFGWSELNILSELYAESREYFKAIKFIKSTARWLYSRSDEVWWNDVDDDSEYDDRHYSNINYQAYSKIHPHPNQEYTLPLDLRAKLALYRLKLNDVKEAVIHADFFLNQDVHLYADLFLEIGDAMREAGEYETALKLYVPLSDVDEHATDSLVMSMGRCLRELGDLEQAEKAYRTVVEDNPLNFDAKLFLAEILEATGNKEDALEIVRELEKIRRENGNKAFNSLNKLINFESSDNNSSKQIEYTDESINQVVGREANEKENENGDNKTPSFILNINDPKRIGVDSILDPNGEIVPSPTGKMSSANRLAYRMASENAARKLVAKKFSTLSYYRQGMLAGNVVSLHEWLHIASELVDIFTNTKAFYLSDKNRVYKGFRVYTSKRAAKMDLDTKLDGMASRLKNSLDISGMDELLEGEKGEEAAATEFRGVSLDDWFYVCMQYILLLTKYEDVEDAYSVLKRVKEANVFYQNKDRERIMQFVYMSCVCQVKDYEAAQEPIRDILNSYPFCTDTYRMYTATFSSGYEAISIFAHSIHQKFFLRHIKSFDSVIYDKDISGALRISEKLRNPQQLQQSQQIQDVTSNEDVGFKSSTEKNINEVDNEGDENANENANESANLVELKGEDLEHKKQEHAVLLTLYGHILYSSRSYIPCLIYYMRAYKIAAKDPLLLLCIGLTHIHRARQRLSTNRHLQILEGISFFLDYFKVRKEEGERLKEVKKEESDKNDYMELFQEIYYNMGCMYHFIGMTNLAIIYYEKVLEFAGEVQEGYDLSMEAAYNLQLIYALNGNGELARRIVEDHLTI